MTETDGFISNKDYGIGMNGIHYVPKKALIKMTF